jgi:hypothetical protein
VNGDNDFGLGESWVKYRAKPITFSHRFAIGATKSAENLLYMVGREQCDLKISRVAA